MSDAVLCFNEVVTPGDEPLMHGVNLVHEVNLANPDVGVTAVATGKHSRARIWSPSYDVLLYDESNTNTHVLHLRKSVLRALRQLGNIILARRSQLARSE